MLHNKPTITALIVDDESLSRKELIRLLKAHPHIEVVSEAESGSDAIHIIDSQNIDLVFLDINMPGLSGLQIARNIKNSGFILVNGFAEAGTENIPVTRNLRVFKSTLCSSKQS